MKNKPLVLARSDPSVNEPFEPFTNDSFGRKQLAERLTGYVDRLNVGAVLAIDAPWGSGKTWFALNWIQYLKDKSNEHSVIYINAFESDYIDDPFLLLAAEITLLAKKKENLSAASSLQNEGIMIMKNLAPSGLKLMVNFLGKIMLNRANLIDEFEEAIDKLNDDIANKTEQLLVRKFEQFDEEKKCFDNFKISLRNFCLDQKKPVVIFIDELDRCKPSFAVQIIERIKHLFDVPHLVFVLCVNKNQLENAIKGVYGSDTDASKYLNKFVNMYFSLPKFNSFDLYINRKHPIIRFVSGVLEKHDFKRVNYDEYRLEDRVANEFRRHFTFCALMLKLSLRDIERACTLFILSDEQERGGFIAYIIALKISDPMFYNRIIENDFDAHDIAKKQLQAWRDRFPPTKPYDANCWEIDYCNTLKDIHNLAQSNWNQKNTSENIKMHAASIVGFRPIINCFLKANNMIDLEVELS